MSKHQQTTAIRVANIPQQDFEDMVESDDPTTINELATLGKKARPNTACRS